jgi:predicted GNAT superfamily acetyltransferase
MNELQFRPLESGDLRAVHAMNEAAVPAVSHVSIEELRDLDSMAEHFMVAVQGDALAGFIILLASGASYTSLNYQWFSVRFNDFLYVDRIVIDSSFHRQGIASRFYAQAWDTACQRSIPLTCEVNVEPPNPQSMAFHEALGFHELGRQPTEGGAKQVSLMAREN